MIRFSTRNRGQHLTQRLTFEQDRQEIEDKTIPVHCKEEGLLHQEQKYGNPPRLLRFLLNLAEREGQGVRSTDAYEGEDHPRDTIPTSLEDTQDP
jgi:hypothetical protein